MAGLILKFLRFFPHVMRLEDEVRVLHYSERRYLHENRSLNERLRAAHSANAELRHRLWVAETKPVPEKA